MGANFEVAEYASTGSGSPAVRGCSITRTPGARNPCASTAVEEALRLVLRALDTAAEADTATGGVDRNGRIFPVIKIITARKASTTVDRRDPARPVQRGPASERAASLGGRACRVKAEGRRQKAAERGEENALSQRLPLTSPPLPAPSRLAFSSFILLPSAFCLLPSAFRLPPSPCLKNPSVSSRPSPTDASTSRTRLPLAVRSLTFNYAGGILLFTLGRERQKIFEIYDRIALAAIGHPGDIERLRMTAIEIASTEGFTRSAERRVIAAHGELFDQPSAEGGVRASLRCTIPRARMLFVRVGRGGGAKHVSCAWTTTARSRPTARRFPKSPARIRRTEWHSRASAEADGTVSRAGVPRRV